MLYRLLSKAKHFCMLLLNEAIELYCSSFWLSFWSKLIEFALKSSKLCVLFLLMSILYLCYFSSCIDSASLRMLSLYLNKKYNGLVLPFDWSSSTISDIVSSWYNCAPLDTLLPKNFVKFIASRYSPIRTVFLPARSFDCVELSFWWIMTASN